MNTERIEGFVRDQASQIDFEPGEVVWLKSDPRPWLMDEVVELTVGEANAYWLRRGVRLKFADRCEIRRPPSRRARDS